jgi:transposase
MASIPVFVGLDYHQDSVQVCVLSAEGKRLFNRSVSNDAGLIAEIANRYGRPQRLAIEACCGAADLAETLVLEWNLPVELAHPGYVARLKRSPDKTDLGDAQLLADLTRVHYLPTVWLAPEATRQLRRLVRHRAQLVQRRRDVKLRIRGLLRENRIVHREARAWTKGWLAWLKHEAPLPDADRWIMDEHLDELTQLTVRIAACEARINQATADDPLMQRLLQLPEVGLVTAATLRAEIGRFDRFQTGKQLARFAGVTPCNASSGARQADAGLIRAGNPALRTVLIELAHRLIHRSKGRWFEFSGQMLRRGKPKNVVVAAVANRWMRWVYHELQRTPSDLSSGSTKGRTPLPPSPSHRPVARVKVDATAEGARGGS